MFAAIGLATVYYLNVNEKCKVSVLSKSRLLDLGISDTKVFKRNIQNYISCSRGRWQVGGETFEEIRIITTDDQLRSSSKGPDGKSLMTYQVDNTDKTIDVLFQVNSDFLARKTFNSELAVTISSLVYSISQPRPYKLQKSPGVEYGRVLMKDLGLKYENK